MSLRWRRDGLATIAVAGLGAIAVASYRGWDWPIVASPRVVAIVALPICVGMCAVGATESFEPKPGEKSLPRRLFLSAGLLATLLMVTVLIWPRHVLLAVLCALIGALWFTMTLRHALMRSTTPPKPPRKPRRARPRKPRESQI